jgi:ribosomal-protein-alanine N-acetyltransferase
MAVVRQEAIGMPELDIRAMQEADIAAVLRIERASYAFPWTEGIFRDCLRVHYTCRVAAIGVATGGYGILSVAAGEAHLLNLCVADAYRCRGIGRRLLAHLLLAAGAAGAREAFLEARPVQHRRDPPVSVAGICADRHAARLLSGHRRPRRCDRAQAAHRLESRAFCLKTVSHSS